MFWVVCVLLSVGNGVEHLIHLSIPKVTHSHLSGQQEK